MAKRKLCPQCGGKLTPLAHVEPLVPMYYCGACDKDYTLHELSQGL